MCEEFLSAIDTVMNLAANFFAFRWARDAAGTCFADCATSAEEENAPQQQVEVTPEAPLGESDNRVDDDVSEKKQRNESMEERLAIANKPLGNMYLPIAEMPSGRKFKAGRLEAIPEERDNKSVELSWTAPCDDMNEMVLPTNGRSRRLQGPGVKGT